MNSPSFFEIQAHEPQKVVEFYSSVFGWKCTQDKNLPIEYWRVETEGIRGAILKRAAPMPPPQSGTNAYVCSIEVEDFDATAEKILHGGGIVALPKFAVPGKCWQGYFIDPQGNTFGLFQVDTTAQ